MQAEKVQAKEQEDAEAGLTTVRDGIIAAAEEACRLRGLNLTPIRRRVLELVAGAPFPVSAYAIIRRLSDKTPLGPPTVYRALDFWMKAGWVHHLRSRRAYICHERPCEGQFAALFTCVACGRVGERASEPLRQGIMTVAVSAGFEPQGRSIEVEGRCAACRGTFHKGVPR